jgi:hypothetical protein
MSGRKGMRDRRAPHRGGDIEKPLPEMDERRLSGMWYNKEVRYYATKRLRGFYDTQEKNGCGVYMPTVTVVLRNAKADGKMMTRRFRNAEVFINPTTKLLQVLRSDVPQIDGQEILAEFPSETYLSWE